MRMAIRHPQKNNIDPRRSPSGQRFEKPVRHFSGPVENHPCVTSCLRAIFFGTIRTASETRIYPMEAP